MFLVTENLRQTLQCKGCANAKAEQGGETQFHLAVDPTVCAQCHADYGQTELPLVGGLPACESCRQAAYNRPFPAWLTFSFAALLILLVVALVKGGPYFRAARDLYRSERLVGQKKYAAAAPILEGVLKIAPASEKAILLAAKAYMLGGEPEKGYAVIKHKGEYKKGPLTDEVKSIFERADRAFGKSNEASKAVNEERETEGLALMLEGQKLYPEWPGWIPSINVVEGALAFTKKDYDRFLEMAERNSKSNPDDPEWTATVASALACKYAVAGNAEFRARAEATLEKARAQAVTPEQQTSFAEYSKRIQYRLRSREIITKQEYDRRFRPAESDGPPEVVLRKKK